MVAMVAIGMSSLAWAVIVALLVAAYKFAPSLRIRYETALLVGTAPACGRVRRDRLK